MLRRILAGSRYLIIIAVIGSFLASIILFVYGGLTVLNIMLEVIAHSVFTPSEAKQLSIEEIEVIDQFLLATVLYIVAVGLYELFIDPSLPVLPWLVITSLDDLKARLIGVIAVLLAVTFLGNVVSWNGNPNIVALGIAIGLVLFALGYILTLSARTHRPTDQSGLEPEQEQHPQSPD